MHTQSSIVNGNQLLHISCRSLLDETLETFMFQIQMYRLSGDLLIVDTTKQNIKRLRFTLLSLLLTQIYSYKLITDCTLTGSDIFFLLKTTAKPPVCQWGKVLYSVSDGLLSAHAA